MKSGIHPQLHQTKIICACGAHYVIPGTLQELHTEICMACHPHYTGKKKLVDTEGRVDKFMSKFKGAAKKEEHAKDVQESSSEEAMKAEKTVKNKEEKPAAKAKKKKA